MAREASITLEQVAAAADALKAAGGKPTSRAIRERLGNTGSMGTVHKMLQRWKAGQERQIDRALTLPPALQRAILDFMDQELASARAALETELAEQQQETADLATENERQGHHIEALQNEVDAMRADAATNAGRVAQLEADLATAHDETVRERQAAEAARTELAKAQLRLEALPRIEAGADRLRAELDAERQARAEAEQKAAVLAAKLESENEQRKKAEGQLVEYVRAAEGKRAVAAGGPG